jgi:hypothetical protein
VQYVQDEQDVQDELDELDEQRGWQGNKPESARPREPAQGEKTLMAVPSELDGRRD